MSPKASAGKAKPKPAAKAAQPTADIVATLQDRFGKNMARHPGIQWADVQARLTPAKRQALQRMEDTGGEPDVVGRDPKTGEFLVVDCSPQSPAGRRSACYDKAARDARKEAKPKTSAMEMAKAMGVELLTEQQYRDLQALGEVDTTTSSWVQTPADIRGKGGALFCDRRYGQVFLYHNGAESYYAARGFRALLRV
jgi:hypothetical protein